jgi:hypothetical protein
LIKSIGSSIVANADTSQTTTVAPIHAPRPLILNPLTSKRQPN